jgi:uncharacterized membrane protein
MRSMIIATALAAFAAVALVHPAQAKKSKMGCEVGREVWDAGQGKCVAGKYTRKKTARKGRKDE